MRTAVASLFLLTFVVASSVAGPSEAARQPTLLITAHQDFGLSLTHAWTAEVKGTELTVDRPGKQRRTQRLKPVAVERFLRVTRDMRFQVLPAHLGQVGSCDDCARCMLVIDAGKGPHRVERVAESGGEPQQGDPSEDSRFRTVWVEFKALAGVTKVPDACW